MDDNSNSRTTTGGQAVIEDDLTNLLAQKVVGQSAATKAIVPYVYMYQSGLAPESRPAGVFLLLSRQGWSAIDESSKAEQIRRGKLLYLQNCVICHQSSGQGSPGGIQKEGNSGLWRPRGWTTTTMGCSIFLW